MPASLDPKDLVKLVTDEELPDFAAALGCDTAEPDLRRHLEDAVENCSRTRVLRAVHVAARSAISMISDIIRFLELYAVRIRTTGFVIALPSSMSAGPYRLSPKEVGVLAAFDAAALGRRKSLDWTQALTRWNEDLRPWAIDVVNKSEPGTRRKLKRGALVGFASGRPTHRLYEPEVEVDGASMNRLFSLWRTFDYIVNKLQPIGSAPGATTEASKLYDELSNASRRCTDAVRRIRRDPEVWHEARRYVSDPEPWSADSGTAALFASDGLWDEDEAWDIWQRFVEDVLAIAAHTEFERFEAEDLVRLDLIKDRPRLYELWVMVRILGWYRQWGFDVALLSLVDGLMPTWELNYAKSDVPIAKVVIVNKEWSLFYQLHRQGSDRANMPDLALADGSGAGSQLLWIADPKYSERGGYSKAEYVEVAERYAAAFSPRAVWVCERFPRPDVAPSGRLEVRKDVEVLTDVWVGGRGLDALRESLRGVHGLRHQSFVLAIDCSSSFAASREALGEDIVALAAQAEAVFAFASSTVLVDLVGMSPADLPARLARLRIGSGTSLLPLKKALEDWATTKDTVALFVLTDGEFGDRSADAWKDLNQLFSVVEVTSAPRSFARTTRAS